jgi:hypothetical protein
MGRMIALGRKVLHIQRQHVLRAFIHTQFAALAINLTDNDGAF